MYSKKMKKVFWWVYFSSYTWAFEHYRGTKTVAVDLTRFLQNLMRHKQRKKTRTAKIEQT